MSAADTHPERSPQAGQGVALCLSGGGYRAALFHLGGLRRLDQLGILSQVDTIASVSGGSILSAQIAGHLVANPQAWGRPGDRIAGFEDGIAAPMIALAQRDIRTRAALARFWPPWNLFRRNAQMDGLTRKLSVGYAGAGLAEVPEHPRFLFCATDVVNRTLWTFDSKTRAMGNPRAGWAPFGDLTIARAAAASSCVPLLFRPMRIEAALEGGTGDCPGAPAGPMDIVDGGFYDDLGIESVWDDHAVVLVSDGTPGFKPRPRIPRLIWNQLRPVITVMEQATEPRARWFRARLRQGELAGGYWGIPSLPSGYGYRSTVPPYPDELIRCWIQFVRDDVDPFSEGEQAVLQNHGYLMADIAINATAPSLIRLPSPPVVPFPDYMEEANVKQALESSDRPRISR